MAEKKTKQTTDIPALRSQLAVLRREVAVGKANKTADIAKLRKEIARGLTEQNARKEGEHKYAEDINRSC